MAVGAQGLAVDPGLRTALMIPRRSPPSMCATTAVEATFTSTTWSSPTRLKLFSSASTPWISWALIIAVRTSRMTSGFFRCDSVTGHPVGGGEDAAQVVGGVAPFGGQPGVVEIEPADHRADVEGRLHRVELELRAGNLGAVRHHRPRTIGPSSLVQAGYAAPRGRSPACPSGIAGRVVGLLAVDVVVVDVVGDVDQNLVGFGRTLEMGADILFPVRSVSALRQRLRCRRPVERGCHGRARRRVGLPCPTRCRSCLLRSSPRMLQVICA